MINELKFRGIGINTKHENIIFMRPDCHICRSEGFEALTRVNVNYGNKTFVATINVIEGDLLKGHEASLSKELVSQLKIKDGDVIHISHLPPLDSFGLIRSKIYGNKLNMEQMQTIINDVVKGDYSSIQLSSLITAFATQKLNDKEIEYLTKSMINSGEKLGWEKEIVVDKHCIGGIPANRTTPIVVSIIAAFGLVIPKTSSRAITSPAGTADTMEVMTPVNLDINAIKEVVSKENGCLAWGGSVMLSPADDLFIRVERVLDLDSEGQMIASVLSKKVAAGATHVLIDIPYGSTAKVRTRVSADHLKELFEKVGNSVGLAVSAIVTDGSQPIGNGIGPSLEAMDVLKVLRNDKEAPKDLREKSIMMAGEILEMSGKTAKGQGYKIAEELLTNGMAYKKFSAICNAQGGFSEPKYAKFSKQIEAIENGTVSFIDNRKIAKVAKLAGAPNDQNAGAYIGIKLGHKINKGDVLYTIYAETTGQMDYVLEYINNTDKIIGIG